MIPRRLFAWLSGREPAAWHVDAEMRRTPDLVHGQPLARGVAALAMCLHSKPGETRWTITRHGSVMRFRPFVRLGPDADLWISAGYYAMPRWRFLWLRFRNGIGLGPKRAPLPEARALPRT